MASDFDRLLEFLKGLEARLLAIESTIKAGVTVRVSLDPTASSGIHEKLDRIIQQGEVMSGELQRLTAAVTVIKGKADSLIALVQGLAQLIRDNAGDPVALNNLADQLETESAAIQAAIDANPLPSQPPTTTTTLAPGAVGSAYTAQVNAHPGVAPFTYVVTAGALPAGLALDLTSGAITGTPESAGQSIFTVKWADASTTETPDIDEQYSILIS